MTTQLSTRLLSPPEAACRFGVSLSTLEKMTRAKIIEKYRVSARIVRYKESDIEAVIEALPKAP